MGQSSRIAGRIKRLRKASGLSRQQLADRLKTSYLRVYRIENGITPIPLNDIPAFAKALDVDVAALYGVRS